MAYFCVYQGGSGEIVEKKSRFIAYVKPVETEEEALLFIESIKKKHWDARHNCYAYVIGQRSELQRASDDGEPQGTAGRPMLDVLNGAQLHNTVVVVTRYFGGVLLGTGGLVRAYSQAVQAGLEASIIIEKKAGACWKVTADYTDYGKLQYLLAQRKIPVLQSDFQEKVRLELVVPLEEEGKLRSELQDAVGGRAEIERTEECFFADVEGETLLFAE